MDATTIYFSDTTLALAGLIAISLVALLVSRTRRSESISPTDRASTTNDRPDHVPLQHFDLSAIDDATRRDASEPERVE